MRALLKSVVESALLRSGAAALSRRRYRGRSLVLAYHNVVPDDAEVAGDASLHVRQGRFEAQLAAVRRTHDVVPLEALLEPGGVRPRVAVTFDDAYRGAMTAGLEVLEALDVPATVFVVPSFVGGPAFWWDRLAAGGLLSPEARERALDRHRGRHGEVMAAFGPDVPGRDRLTEWDHPATEAELERALGHPGLRYGSHSWSHPNLARLEPGEVDEEAVRSRRWLRERFPDRFVDALAFPYGRWSPVVAARVRAAGYRMAFRIDGGWVPTEPDTAALPRLNVPAGLSPDGLELRAAGLLGG